MAEFKIDTNGVQYFEHEGIKIGIGGNGEITSDTIPLEGLMQAVEEIQQAQVAQAQGRAFPISRAWINKVWSSERGTEDVSGKFMTEKNHGGHMKVETIMYGDGMVFGFVNERQLQYTHNNGDSYSAWYHYWDLGVHENAIFKFRATSWGIADNWESQISIL
ncbi:hypothetical protein CCZ01_01895 [Helicobacter monodelphidis]|uniref:DUF4879 domain-containing protein n=1 Tax=Helicobacter sp. 15-1451 TaxID=2004995 RepID=UPI000DCAFBF1|nr:DUF4879 domain-containing protein [Helicobacter sp. 15-1451]RAX58559.1 hypothetical protein CCZ01_01895 [Helicobacter sp. 15-1451]